MFSKPDKLTKKLTWRGVTSKSTEEWKPNKENKHLQVIRCQINESIKERVNVLQQGKNAVYGWLTRAPIQAGLSSLHRKTCQQSWAHKCRETGGRFRSRAHKLSAWRDAGFSCALCSSSKQQTITSHTSHLQHLLQYLLQEFDLFSQANELTPSS